MDSISCSTRGHRERSSRIDTDDFQYEGVLSKIGTVGLGEKVDAGEEEKQEEIFKVTRHVAREFRLGLVGAEPDYGSSQRSRRPPRISF